MLVAQVDLWSRALACHCNNTAFPSVEGEEAASSIEVGDLRHGPPIASARFFSMEQGYSK